MFTDDALIFTDDNVGPEEGEVLSLCDEIEAAALAAEVERYAKHHGTDRTPVVRLF